MGGGIIVAVVAQLFTCDQLGCPPAVGFSPGLGMSGSATCLNASDHYFLFHSTATVVMTLVMSDILLQKKVFYFPGKLCRTSAFFCGKDRM